MILKRRPCPDSLPTMPSPPKSIRASNCIPPGGAKQLCGQSLVVSRIALATKLIPIVFKTKAICNQRLVSRWSPVRCSNLNRLGIGTEMRETTAFGQENRGTFLPPEPFRAGKVFPVELRAVTSDSAAPGEKEWEQKFQWISSTRLATLLPHDTVASWNCVG